MKKYTQSEMQYLIDTSYQSGYKIGYEQGYERCKFDTLDNLSTIHSKI